jgi:ferredoxin/flavodoxin---NADP+ reductase
MLDVLIIGAGPSGLYAGYLASTQHLQFKILEATDASGGQIKLYQDKPIYDMASYKEILGQSFIHNLESQLLQHVSDVIMFHQEVVDIKGSYPHFTIMTKTDVFEAKHVILASGGGLFLPKTLDIKDEESYINISYAVNNAKQYEGKNLVIFGGGDSAIDWAHYFMNKGSNVSLIHRRDTFRAQQHLLDEVLKGSNVYTSYQLDSVTGHPHISKINMKHVKTLEEKTILCDHLFVFYGNIPQPSLKHLPLITFEKGYLVNSQMMTSIDGIYATGNMASYEGKVQMIVTGLGEAATAIGSITNRLNPKKKMSYGSLT